MKTKNKVSYYDSKVTTFHSNECPIHHCKLGETAMGVKWCPKCEGDRMAKEVSAKLTLNLNLEKPQYHCVLCGEHGDYAHFDLDVPGVPHTVFACPKCREYKGLEACDKTDVRKCSLE